MTDEERKFLEIVTDKRPLLIEKLQELGLLSSFLEAEEGGEDGA